MRAGLAVRKGAVHYSFETENLGQPPHRIEVRLASGPFRRLVGAWQFQPSALGTRVVFKLTTLTPIELRPRWSGELPGCCREDARLRKTLILSSLRSSIEIGMSETTPLRP